MAANGGKIPNLPQHTTIPNRPKRKPVAERNNDDTITHLAAPKRSADAPKLCGNTFFGT